MEKRLLYIIGLIAVMGMIIAPLQAYAQAYSTSFTTSITYQNVGSGSANIVVSFYASPDTTTPIQVSLPALAQGASSSLHVGTLSSVPNNFRGSAVMSSDQPLVATMVQLPQGASPGTRNRPLSNGFSTGGNTVLIATVLKNYYNTNTIFSVQNIGNTAANLTFRFYNTSATEVYSFTQTVQPGAAYYVDAGQLAGLGSSFNGSAVVESSGTIAGSVLELSTTGSGASSFEGVSAGATKVYMPSALCNAFGANTSYAVQNTSLTSSAIVTVTYSNGSVHTQSIGPGAKKSFVACDAPGMSAGFSGSAVIESNGVPIVAIGKAYGSGLSTAFVGATGGASKIALPYVRWANDTNWANGTQQRVFLTIQNVGTTDLPAGAVTVRYIDKNGNQVGTTHSLPAIPAGGKANSNATNAGLSEFGVYPDGTFGGGAIVEGPPGSQLAVVARVSTQIAPGLFASEDYSGIPVP
ncbi:MAG: hypothetical protein QXS54_04160 [Candidatus Methanomethylicaceae archaeon]